MLGFAVNGAAVVAMQMRIRLMMQGKKLASQFGHLACHAQLSQINTGA